jgi:hypothetical protein
MPLFCVVKVQGSVLWKTNPLTLAAFPSTDRLRSTWFKIERGDHRRNEAER